MTSNYVWEYGTQHERVATEEEFDKITKDIHYEFVKDGKKIQYSHKVRCKNDKRVGIYSVEIIPEQYYCFLVVLFQTDIIKNISVFLLL
jgi:hypothetical protein